MAPTAKAQKVTAQKQAEEQALSYDGILQPILRFVGAGQHWFVASISQRFRAQYRLVLASVPRKNHLQLMTDPTCTVYKAACVSASRLELACEEYSAGRFDDQVFEFALGQHADNPTLEAGKQLGMNVTSYYTLYGAALSGCVDKVQYLGSRWRQDWLAAKVDQSALLLYAVHAGSVSLVKHLLQKGVQCHRRQVIEAARVGSLDILKLLCSTGEQWGADCKLDIMQQAAKGGHTQILNWGHARGFPLNIAFSTCASSSTAALQWLTRTVVELQWNYAHLEHAVRFGSFSVFQHLLSCGCEARPQLFTFAAARQSMSILKQLIEMDACEITDSLSKQMYCEAASVGNLLTIKWLRETVQLRWSAYRIAMEAVTSEDTVEILQYLHDQGARIKEAGMGELLARAGLGLGYGRTHDSHECAKWLRAHGAPWPDDIRNWTEAAKRWAYSQGYREPSCYSDCDEL